MKATTSGEPAAATGSSGASPARNKAQPHQGTVPARTDPHRAGATLHHLDRHGVLELEHGALALGRQSDLDDGDLGPERHAVAARRLALENVAA
ncbi:hypothetical protein GCM10009790_37070 [Georgenia ruanii]